MSGITCKFGGTSLADANAIRQAAAIVEANAERRYVVPSAPGKRTPEDKKITDLLYAWHNLTREGLDASQPMTLIGDRFRALEKELGVAVDISGKLEAIAREAAAYKEADFLASRGEYLNGLLVAALLGATFVDPAEYIRFNDEGLFDETCYTTLGKALSGPGRFVVPGFYGARADGRIKTFSRGGSDVTGAIVARATNSALYENWTDVSGFLMADPRIVKNPKHIDEITYKELRELSYMGANVLHDEAIFPVREPGIPINIRNTHRPEDRGTLIVPQRRSDAPVCGIAGSPGFTMINIEKTLMNKERGFGRKVLTILEEHAVSWEHMPTGIDTISLIVRDAELGENGPAVLHDIERHLRPDRVSLAPSLALIATVGQGMVHHIGVAAKLCAALAAAGVNLRVIDQGSSEMNIIVGVESEDLEKAVRALYHAFVE